MMLKVLKVVKTNQMEALRQVLGDGQSRTMPEIQAAIVSLTGKSATKGSVQVLMSNLRTKFGFTIAVTRGKRGEESSFQLQGATGRLRKRKSA